MRAAMRDYNVELAGEGLPALSVGIGIHRGPGLAGLVGSRERMEYAFVGRTVNLAARVQGLTRVHKVDILVTEALRPELDRCFVLEPMPAEMVKGVDDPVVTYAVRGTQGPAAMSPKARPAEAFRHTERVHETHRACCLIVRRKPARRRRPLPGKRHARRAALERPGANGSAHALRLGQGPTGAAPRRGGGQGDEP
jgi:hypothetical protein